MHDGTTIEVAKTHTYFVYEMSYKQVCEKTRTSKRKFSATYRWRSECRRIIPCGGGGR
jgi:hypothetical protein